MKSSLVRLTLSPRALGAAALLMVSIFSPNADAMSPVNPGSAVAKPIASVPTIEVRGGGHGGGGGGGHGGGGWGGGRSFGGGGMSGALVRGGAVGAGSAAFVAAPGGVAGLNRHAGHGVMGHGFHRHHRVFVDGVYYDDYSYDDAYYDYPDYPAANPAPLLVGGAGCYRVLTEDGPRVVCQHRAYRHYHLVHRRHHHRRHHHA